MLEFTEKCNNRCHYCYNIWKINDRKCDKELTTEEWKFVIEKLKRETGCRNVTISGGEPTLRPDFLEIAEYMKIRMKQFLEKQTGKSGLQIAQERYERFRKM